MSNTFTAQELADFYQKVADGGEVEFRLNCNNLDWYSSGCDSPCLHSFRQDWRVRPKKKVINLSPAAFRTMAVLVARIDKEQDNAK